MSFILDALKKSEAERQRQAGPALLEMRIVRPARRLPLWALVVGLLLIINVAVLAWLAWRPAPMPVATAPSIVAASTPIAITPAVVNAPAAQPALDVGASNTETGDNPADAAPAVAPAVAPSRLSNDANNLHNYVELSGKLPELRLDLHVYASNPSDRYAFINMRKVHEGDVTPDGVEVKEITREGVVLDFQGTEFLLGRQ